jgi:hypothetical protein
MRAQCLGLASLGLLLLAGCEAGNGGQTGISGPPTSYADISGQYTAPVASINVGLALTGTMYLNLNQTDSAFSGSYQLVGTVFEGVDSLPITLSGALVNGMLDKGFDPALQMELQPTGCLSTFVLNVGSYATASKVITIPSAQIPVQDLACTELLKIASDSLTFTHP